MVYWDTSALLKLYLTEPDSATFVALAIESNDQIVSSAIIEIEMLCGLNRRERSGDLKPGGATLFRRFASDVQSRKILTIGLDADVTAAERLGELSLHPSRPVMLRALDAVHVASAMACKAKTIVAADHRLRQAAALVRLKVLPEQPL